MALIKGKQIKDGSINESKLNVSNTPTEDYVLSYSAGTMVWVDPAQTGDITDITAGDGLTGGGSGGNVTLSVATDGIDDTHIDWGTGANQVNAADMPMESTPAGMTATTVQEAVAELSTLQALKAVPTSDDKNITPSATSGDNQSAGVTISNTPTDDGYVTVSVNGVVYVVGDGVKTKDCYFSADSGTTAKAMDSIVATDTLYWNGVIAGFDLEVDDSIDLNYDVLK